MWNNSSRRSFNHSKFTGLITHSFYIEMQSRCIQVVFVISSLILFKAQHVIGSGLSCLRSSSAAHRQKRITFLREDADGVRSLYTSLWSDDTRPVICEVNTDPIVTDRYCRICERTGTQGQEITQRFNISMLLSPNSPCALVSSSSVPKFTKRTRRAGIEGKVRRKRAWIFPGTLWCGTGSKAAGYEQLGMFESADRCCREHDHCLHVILAFTVNYGVFNSNLFTVSLCDCDQRFRQCLLGVNDTISSMVGYSFFNILQVPCFELKQQKQCTEMNWWGTCKVTKKAPYAVFKSPLPFSAVTSNNGDNTDSNMVARSKGKHVTESFVINPHKKSPKGERRCNSRDRLKGDTFYLRRTEGKGCKKHRKLNTTTPSQLPPMSIVYTTSPSIKKGILNASKSTVMMPIKKRTGKKKSNMNGLSDYVTQRQNSYPQTTSARQSSPSLTQKPALQLHLSTTITAVTKSHKEVPKQSRCCGFKMPLRGDTFQPHCKSCLEQKKTLSVTPVTPSTITYGLPVKMATDMTLRLKQTTETPKQDTLQRLWSAATSATAVITKPDISTSIHKKGKPQKQRKSLLRQNNTRQEHMGSTTALSTGAGRDLMQNISLNNMTENQLLCGSLILLDECKYNILPLEKKYDLQNRESKTAYHCDCTSRLAVQIGSFKQPSILPKLLMDFVSQYCFKLPNERKCHRRKSCSGGFSKASDLLQALSVMEEKDTAGVQNAGNGRRRGIPTRLYKRCLRQVREADVLAQLTRF